MIKSSLANWSIRKKLTFIIGLTIWLAMVLGAIAFITYDQRSAKQTLANEATILAKVIAERSGAAVLFGDRKTAQSNLETLDIHPAIMSACLYNKSGSSLAKYAREGQVAPCDAIDNFIAVSAPVLVKSNQVGSITLKVSLAEVNNRLWRFGGLALFIQLVAGVLAYWLTYRLQASVVGPILKLRDIATKVSNSHDYSLRAKQQTGDEVGDLVSGFNEMLHTIQESHFQLQEAMRELDEKREQSLALAQSSESRRQQISDYFAGASHDLRQPLNAMGLYIEELQALSDKPNASVTMLSKLSQSMINLETLLDQLLDASKLEEGVKKPKRQTICLKSLCKKIAQEMSILAEDKSLRFQLHLPKDQEAMVDTDPLMLERIIRNLISNSIRYTDKGGVMLAIRKRLDSYSIEIWDTGVGIPKAKQASIFDSHVQLGNERQDASKGFGLGLSIVKRLSELLDYPLSLRSEVDKGTVFKLQIPDSRQSIAEPTAAIDPLHGSNVLLVDDDVDVLVAMEAMLGRWGINVELADSYEGCKEYFESMSDNTSSYPDFIISDFNFNTSETGLDVISLAEAVLPEQNVKSIIVTGESSPDILDQIAAREIPMLKKPIKPAKLRALMVNLLTQ